MEPRELLDIIIEHTKSTYQHGTAEYMTSEAMRLLAKLEEAGYTICVVDEMTSRWVRDVVGNPVTVFVPADSSRVSQEGK